MNQQRFIQLAINKVINIGNRDNKKGKNRSRILHPRLEVDRGEEEGTGHSGISH